MTESDRVHVLTDAEVIQRDYRRVDGVDICVSCGVQAEGLYVRIGAIRPEAQCLSCLLSALQYGRRHTPEAFEEEL